MLPIRRVLLLTIVSLTSWLAGARFAAADEPSFKRQEDVIYGRKFGTALTMDIFSPREHANGRGIVYVISGGWYSSHDFDGMIPVFKRFTDHGYAVFAVVHGSQPKFTIPECIADLNRAVRFIRFHAKDYAIDPDHIGITGMSAGGHLSLMMGAAGNDGDPHAKDPIERVSSRVQAVACFFPPTDFLNYGKEGENAVGRGTLHDFKAPFDFHEFDPRERMFVKVADENKIQELGRQVSPITHVSPDDAPTLIFHGDKDLLVPMQQAEIIVDKLNKAGVDAKLVVKPGAQHGWPNNDQEWTQALDWFDKYLKTPAKGAAQP